jgi:pyruvate dehydrogenase E1 component alpha subunit
VRQPQAIEIHQRARSYGMSAKLVDGNDVFAVHQAAREAVAAARGNGPYFLECTTYRWREHVGPLWDYDWGYRTKEEVDGWIARCPIKRATERLIAEGVLSAADVKALEGELQAEVDRAVARAKAAPFPAVEDLMLGTC